MNINGIAGMTPAQLDDELQRGARFVYFPYVISIVVLTFRRSSDVFFLRPGESAFAKGWPYALISLLLGWWGFPWGLIHTPAALFEACAGGKDITHEMANHLLGPPMQPEPVPAGY